MTGSLQIKNNKYYMVLNAHDQQGKRAQKWLGTGLEVRGNKKKAEQMLRDCLGRYKPEVPRGKLKFSDWVREWLRIIATQIDIVTLKGYNLNADNHVLPYFDKLGVTLGDLNWHILQEYYDMKYECGRLNGKGGLAVNTLRSLRKIINQSLEEAVRQDILEYNPHRMVRFPKCEPYKPKFYNAEQMNSMLASIADEELAPLIRVTATFGLRRSEALGIKWNSLDFDSNVLRIQSTVVKMLGRHEKETTKNSSSRRTLPLSPEMRELFLELREQENSNRQKHGESYIESEYVFKLNDGTPLDPDDVTRKFSDILSKYGFPHIRFHELRHSCASILIAQGFTLKDVQEWLGHSSIKTTADVYSHLEAKRKVEIAEGITNVLVHKC